MLFATYLSLVPSAFAATAEDLLYRCPLEYFEWTEDNVPTENEWYWGIPPEHPSWEEYIRNGTTPDGASGVYPAGFMPFTLARWSEPPICIMVGSDTDNNDKFNSRDKKVEILMESPMENVNLCINDASYSGTGNNNVGSVANCGTGKIYACFTAATNTAENFGFYVDCKEGCEDMDIDVWIRIRVSSKSWDEGKNTTADDLEHWCEAERGTETDDNEGGTTLYYQYPSDLLPDKPSKYPFHIQQIFGRNAGSRTGPNIWGISFLAVLGLACLFA